MSGISSRASAILTPRLKRAREAMRARLVGPIRRPPISPQVRDPQIDLSGRSDIMDMLRRKYGEQAENVAAYILPPPPEDPSMGEAGPEFGTDLEGVF